jgi:molybdopterin synthase sulfur carrier subunit
VGPLDILYYGRLRDEIGRDREAVDPPSHVLTVEDLLGWLRGRGEPHASALRAGSVTRAAVAGEWAGLGDSLFGAAEVALFPPRGVL